MTTSDYFINRKTIRKYSTKDVDNDTIKSLITEAMFAPTVGNMQLYSVIITRDNDMKKKLAPCHFNQPMVMNAPVVLTFCADFNRFIKWCEASNATPSYCNFQSFISAILDVTIFAQQFNTAAEMAGLGCCYIGTTTYNANQIAEVLSLPKMVVPVITLTVGYPEDAQNEPKVERLPVEAIIHDEQYKEYTPSTIHQLYADKESLEVNKKYVSENNKQSLAQVFTDIRYNKQNNEAFSKIYLDFIVSQGYRFPF